MRSAGIILAIISALLIISVTLAQETVRRRFYRNYINEMIVQYEGKASHRNAHSKYLGPRLRTERGQALFYRINKEKLVREMLLHKVKTTSYDVCGYLDRVFHNGNAIRVAGSLP